jgi:ribonuclease HI
MLAEAVVKGEKRATWRLYDDKDLSVDDELLLIDKVDPEVPSTWVPVGTATIDQVVQKRLEDITEADMEGHEHYESQEAMLAAFRQHYGDKVTPETPVKMIYFSFSPRISAVGGDASPQAQRVQIYADGGSRGNPGPSASGYVIYDDQHRELVYRGVYLGVTTNNQAEYTALKLALEDAKSFGVRDVEVYMDSMLVVNQMKGVFKVKNRDLWPIHDALKQLTRQFRHITFTHVPRELNRLADAAVNEALDKQLDVHPHAV